ncbi:MAG: MBL fold metallo-hydrolase, partial [Dehalococcoidia bacterium]|nr:MBL fold metallo-hydrolase [Dehalococcoidia bacterium]
KSPSPSLEDAGPNVRLVKDGDLLVFENLAIQAIHCPGHSPGSLVYWHADSRTLFTGDHILKRVTLSPMIYFPQGDHEMRTRSLPDYLASLEKVRDLPALRVLPGHGDEFDDLAKAVDRIVHHHARRSERILRSLNGVPSNAFDLLSATFPQLLNEQLRLGMFEIIGHLDTLVGSGRVLEEKNNERYTYRTVDRK